MPVVVLLDRIWDMHPDVAAAAVMSCALRAQVAHLARLPVSGRWMIRFLKGLPACVQTGDGPERMRDMLDDDVSYALAMRRESHGMDGDAVHADALAICGLALRHMSPAMVCGISLGAYREAATDADGRGD